MLHIFFNHWFWFFLLALFACNKNIKEETSATAQLNGTKYDFEVVTTVYDTIFSLSLILLEGDVPRLKSYSTKLPFRIGTHNVRPRAFQGSPDYAQSVLYTMDDDLALDDYLLLEQGINSITVVGIDEKKKWITGTFKLAYVIDTSFTAKMDGFPDTLYLQNGEFKSQYVEN